MMQQYTQGIGYVPVSMNGNPFDSQRAFRQMRHRGRIDRAVRPAQIDRAIRASQIDRSFRQAIDRTGRAIAPYVYRGSTIRGAHGVGALGNPDGGTVSMLWGIASLASTAACAYHGYKRNNSVGWAIGWGLIGGLAPVIAPAIALAQGYAKPKRG